MDFQEFKELQQFDQHLQKINGVFELRIIPALEKHIENIRKISKDTEILSTLAPPPVTTQIEPECSISNALQLPVMTSALNLSPHKLEIPVLTVKIEDSPIKPPMNNMGLPELLTMRHSVADL